MKDEWGFNSLHFYAGFGSKPEELFLLLDHVDEKGEKVNINEEDKGGETPLHKLMSRRDIPLDLLRAFIDHGADVNKDDSDSKSKCSISSDFVGLDSQVCNRVYRLTTLQGHYTKLDGRASLKQ
jgi:ankyrin repeat protein